MLVDTEPFAADKNAATTTAAVDGKQPLRRGHSGTVYARCDAEGCAADLSALDRPYYARKAICPEHMRAPVVRRRGGSTALWRFCQQCGRLEPLSAFDTDKRSCRAALQRRRLQSNPLSRADGQYQHQHQHHRGGCRRSNDSHRLAAATAAAAAPETPQCLLAQPCWLGITSGPSSAAAAAAGIDEDDSACSGSEAAETVALLVDALLGGGGGEASDAAAATEPSEAATAAWPTGFQHATLEPQLTPDEARLASLLEEQLLAAAAEAAAMCGDGNNSSPDGESACTLPAAGGGRKRAAAAAGLMTPAAQRACLRTVVTPDLAMAAAAPVAAPPLPLLPIPAAGGGRWPHQPTTEALQARMIMLRAQCDAVQRMLRQLEDDVGATHGRAC